MTILICGSRHWTNRRVIADVMREFPKDWTIVHGACEGADTIAGEIGKDELGLHVIAVPAEWTKYGRPAGPIRNRKMLAEHKPDAVYGFHDNITDSGTANMCRIAYDAGVPVTLVNSRGERREWKRTPTNGASE